MCIFLNLLIYSKELVIVSLFAGNISPRLVTDAPGITVFCSAILVRLIFGGKLKTGSEVMSKGKNLGTVLVISICFSTVVAGIYAAAVNAGVSVEAFGGSYHVLIFGLAAIGLVFAIAGQPFYGCHHIVIIAAEAAVQSYATTGNAYTALVLIPVLRQPFLLLF